jgi:threonine/homoserine/homoserine lactone efflux protein
MVSLTVNAAIVLSAGTISTFLARRPTWLRVHRYFMGTILAGMAFRIATAPSR